jgi:hypothetical protein
MKIHNYGNDYVHHFKMTELQKKKVNDEHQVKSERDTNVKPSGLRSPNEKGQVEDKTEQTSKVQTTPDPKEAKTEEKSVKAEKGKASKK